ncbi:MAG: hypothetical protein ACTSXC_07130 [Candidatus Freyarchaeota archaeon]
MKAKAYAIAAWLLAAAILGAAWTQQSGSTTVTVEPGGVLGGAFYSIETDQTKIGAPPNFTNVVEGAVGYVTNGSLYGINVSDTGRYMITIFLTNVDELVQAYSYLNLNVTIYNATITNENWSTEGKPLDSQWLTLANGRVILYVDNCLHYLVKIDDGVFYCISTKEGSLSPKLYVMVDQA